jgi:hypothetical protein
VQQCKLIQTDCAPHVSVLHLAQAMLSADAAAALSCVLVQKRLQHLLRQQARVCCISDSPTGLRQAKACQCNAIAHAGLTGLCSVVHHLDGVTIYRRGHIQVQVAVPQVTIADRLHGSGTLQHVTAMHVLASTCGALGLLIWTPA